MGKTIAEINERITKGKAVVVTAEEVIDIAKEKGVRKAAEEVDVVTTGTFGFTAEAQRKARQKQINRGQTAAIGPDYRHGRCLRSTDQVTAAAIRRHSPRLCVSAVRCCLQSPRPVATGQDHLQHRAQVVPRR